MQCNKFQHTTRENGNLVNGIDYTVSSSITNGSPIITYNDASSQSILYNLDRLLVSEAYRRLYPVIYDPSNIYLSGNTSWNISSNSNSTNLCFNYNSVNKSYIDTSGDLYLSGDVFRSGTSLTSTLNSYGLLSNPIFSGSAIYFLSSGNGGWNLSYSSSSFGISLNNVIKAISINNSGIVAIPAGISGYSTTSQVNTLISNSLSSYLNTTATGTLITNALTIYVSNTTLTNYSTTSQTKTLINLSIVTNQNIMSVNFLTFVTSADFSSNVYNYNSLFQALIVDVGAASSGLGTFIQASSSNFTNGQSLYSFVRKS